MIRLSMNARVLIVFAAVVAWFVGSIYVEMRQSTIALLPSGKASFYKGGFFQRHQYELYVLRGRWILRDEALGGGELAVPLECKYSDRLHLRLEDHGRAFLVDKDKVTREEVRVVSGEWSVDRDGTWVSLSDLQADSWDAGRYNDAP